MSGSNIYAQPRMMQNAADAGALAGARAPARGENAQAAATEYALHRNGADSAEVTVDGRTLIVVARKSLPTLFARVIGWSTLQAGAQASASYAPVGAMTGGVLPIAVDLQGFEYGRSYDIFVGAEPGNFGWLG